MHQYNIGCIYQGGACTFQWWVPFESGASPKIAFSLLSTLKTLKTNGAPCRSEGESEPHMPHQRPLGHDSGFMAPVFWLLPDRSIPRLYKRVPPEYTAFDGALAPKAHRLLVSLPQPRPIGVLFGLPRPRPQHRANLRAVYPK